MYMRNEGLGSQVLGTFSGCWGKAELGMGAIPDGLPCCLPWLQDVSSNELQSLPVELCSLPSLRDLNVRRNQLTSLPDGKAPGRGLHHLGAADAGCLMPAAVYCSCF